MPKRAVRVVKHIGATPVVAACTACNRQFQTPTNALRSVKDATQHLQREFDRHTCNPKP